PLIGPLIFGENAMVYVSVAFTIAIAWYLSRTRSGLVLRSIGESHDAAHALVVFSTWKPWRLLFGAYLFGFFSIAQLHAQGFAVPIAPEFLSMLPYLATILVLVIISRDAKRIRLNAPAALGKAFRATA